MTTHKRKLHVTLAIAFVISASSLSHGQTRWARGQNVQPVFEGWERNGDGSFNFVFGYLNRNYEEQPVVLVGPNNFLEPGDLDQGQPTHFYPRRQQFVFKVRVPADWGDKDLVWTVVHNGRTDRAYASFLPVWEMNEDVMRLNRGTGSAQGFGDNQRPSIEVAGDITRSVTFPDSVELVVIARDDGIPPPNPMLANRARVATTRRGPKSQAIVDPRQAAATGLAVTWVHWRGPGTVMFDPQVPDIGERGRAVTTASFSQPGTYVLQAVADDSVLVSPAYVTVNVNPEPAGP